MDLSSGGHGPIVETIVPPYHTKIISTISSFAAGASWLPSVAEVAILQRVQLGIRLSMIGLE